MSIPKNIFQLSIFSNPDYISNNINKYINNWQYKHFREIDLLKYILSNTINDLDNLSNNIELINESPYKKDFLIYYYLYLNGGVYMSENIMIEIDINILLENKSICFIKSCMTDLIFDGFIATEPNNSFILDFLKNFYKLIIDKKYDDYEKIKNDFFKKIIDNIDKENDLLYEDINFEYCKIFNKNNIHVLTHYFNTNLGNVNNIYNKLNIYKKDFNKPKNKINIGLTINIPKNALDLFCNGINQNIFYFAELLLNIGYQCSFIVFDNEYESVSENTLNTILYDNRFKFVKYSDILNENYDIVIIMGTIIHVETVLLLKNLKTIILAYFCGNSYIIDSETILHGLDKGVSTEYILNRREKIYDEIWSIPQMANMNLHYWKTFYRTDCIEVPFIWSPNGSKIIQKIGNILDDNYFLYNKKNTIKKIVICEPNISIMKWCLPCVLICENAYRKISNKETINHVYITNLENKTKFNIESFNKCISTLDIFREKKLSKESRYNILNFMKNTADICVSHTWENGLNYLYLDLAWMGWPIIHNGHLCKDVGYYYDQFNYEEGGDLLLNVIKNHDENIEEYINKNRKIIDRYLPTNKELQDKYEILISNLINKYNFNDNLKVDLNLNVDYNIFINKKVIPIIPLVIYQVWHSDIIPESVLYSINKIKDENPEFEHKLYNLDMCRDYIKNNFEKRILDAFDNIVPYACKFDLWRYCILYNNGGIYLDSKYYPINNFKLYWLTDNEYYCRDLETSYSGIYNAFMIVKPKNKFLLQAINTFVENVETKFYGSCSLEPTGPLMLKKISNNFNININSLNLYLEEIQNNCYIRYKSLSILEMHKNYRFEQIKNTKHWAQYWKEGKLYN